jgi:hypothetical protein
MGIRVGDLAKGLISGGASVLAPGAFDPSQGNPAPPPPPQNDPTVPSYDSNGTPMGGQSGFNTQTGQYTFGAQPQQPASPGYWDYVTPQGPSFASSDSQNSQVGGFGGNPYSAPVNTTPAPTTLGSMFANGDMGWGAPQLGGTHPGWDPRTGNTFVPYTSGPYANQNPGQAANYGDNDPTTLAAAAFKAK